MYSNVSLFTPRLNLLIAKELYVGCYLCLMCLFLDKIIITVNVLEHNVAKHYPLVLGKNNFCISCLGYQEER